MTEEKKHYFHFTLGPVQAFVAQARRTRDFWAGSFLLSWLSAVAIKAVKVQDGKILFPKADESYLKFFDFDGKNEKKDRQLRKDLKGKEPTQGSIPNRFKAEIYDLKTFNPKLVTKAVQEAWGALAHTIWLEDIVPVHSNLTKSSKIWNRQIKGFWDMSWIITDKIADSAVLDQRKNWRNYYAPDEPGVKCMMMDGWQELSGEVSPNRRDINRFWKPIRTMGEHGIKSDLRENEALCAIAFVKRRFSRYFKNLNYPMSQGWRLVGWDIPSTVPSVSYMSAVPWLAQSILKAELSSLEKFQAQVHKLDKNYGEWKTDIKAIEEAKKHRGNGKLLQYFKSIDGDLFYQTTLENPYLYPENEDQKNKVIEALKEVNNTTELDPISPFYAILMMDGDSLGSKMSHILNQRNVTEGLEAFTKGVGKIVYEHHGFLIYAGGDDVLAILPLEYALPCATCLRQHYMQCFEEKVFFYGKNENLSGATLSGAIEYVHIKTPLTKVLKDAHQLLDDIAKDKSGRDSLAIRVWKPGGLQQQWSQPWKIALFNRTDGQQKTYLEQLCEDFQQAQNEDEQFSSKFFYKIRERFNLLNPNQKQHDPCKNEDKKSVEPIFNEQQTIELMAMEYLHSGSTQSSIIKEKDPIERRNKAKDRVRPLLKQCHPITRVVDDECYKIEYSPSFDLEADGALIVRFLAQKGIEK